MLVSQFILNKKSRLVESYEITEAGITFGPPTGKEAFPAGYASDGQMIMHIVRDLLPRLRDDQMTLDVMRSLEAIEKGRPSQEQMQQVMDVYKAADKAGIVQDYKDAIGKFADEEPESDDEMEEGNEFSGALAKAKEEGDDEFEVGGKKFTVEDADMSDEARELALYAENDGDLYRQSAEPVMRNLSKKFKKGVYDHELAAKLWKYHADRAAKSYGKEHGNDDGFAIFSPSVRREVAQYFADSWQSELEAGNAMESIREGEDGASQEDVASAIANRFMNNMDLLNKVLKDSDIGALTQAIDEVAEFHAGAEELGTSDISIMVREVMHNLGIKERKLSNAEMGKREEVVKSLKKHKGDFEKRYGDDAESVMYAVATKRAKGESIEESIMREYKEAGFFD